MPRNLYQYFQPPKTQPQQQSGGLTGSHLLRMMLNALAGRIPLLSQNQKLEEQTTLRYWHSNLSIPYYFSV